MDAVRRVAVVGPESSGKSTLCRMLEDALLRQGVAVTVVAEFARTYYEDRAYDPCDPAGIVAVATGQLAAEDAVLSGLALCDTTALTCRIWAEETLGTVPEDVLLLDRPARYAVHLLTAPLPTWTADPLRTRPSPGDRERVFRRHRELLEAASAPFVVISGTSPAERLGAAMAVLS